MVRSPGRCHPIWDKALTEAVTLVDKCASGHEKVESHVFWEYIHGVHRIIELVAKLQSAALRDVLSLISRTRAKVVASAFLAAAKMCPYSIPPSFATDEHDILYSTIFLLPLIMKEDKEDKDWTASDSNFLAELAKANVSVWKATFDSLSLLEKSPELHEENSLPLFIGLWAQYGALLGIQNLVDPILGCCNADCPRFLQATEFSIGRCSLCTKVWYYSKDCQQKDWKLHKHYCLEGQAKHKR
ncbi:unnamed protein product [Cyclocybe aegerita]|uniref:MYND-type domain-containing protein n=1 Tax=Cyclocybe aegerita TaxID=1973307 RepID=A0A8S0XVB8_CYCAE|nr:unnamed protein product [Cyclocybe aegerita]